MDRLQRTVAGWVGPVVYALPILQVWLLTRLDEDGADAFLVVLQVLWVVSLAGVVVVCGRRWRPPEIEDAPVVSEASRPAAARGAPTRRRRGDHG